MYLTGLIHRERLFELATRWFNGQLDPSDGRFVTEMLTFENLITGPTTRTFLQDIFHAAEFAPVELHRLRLKDELRDMIVARCPVSTPRRQALFSKYREHPEEFFPQTPTDMIVATEDGGFPRGTIRVKRIRRVAEKGSRRIADALADTIRSRARIFAQERAASSGVSLDRLYSSPQTMREDFERAEQQVSQLFREQEVVLGREQMRIDDIIGCKIIGSTQELERVERAISAHPGARLAEREVHRGAYNDTNLLVDLDLPEPAEIVDRLGGRDWCFAGGRGIAPERLERAFPAYVESGARSYRAEIILTSLEELIESEFGRSMHEERVLAQRQTAQYAGRIARNASFLIEYMLRLAISPTVTIDQLPIVMWGRYLADTYSSAVWRLYGIRHGVALMDSFMPEPGELLGGSE